MGMPRLAELASDALMEDMRASGRERLSSEADDAEEQDRRRHGADGRHEQRRGEDVVELALLRVSNSRAGLATKNVRALRTERAFSPRMFAPAHEHADQDDAQTTKNPASTPSTRRSAAGRGAAGRVTRPE